MNRTAPMLLAGLVTAGCATPIVWPERRETMRITWVELDRAYIHAHCSRIGARTFDSRPIAGCASWFNDRCFIWADAPEDMGDYEAFQILGHELAHCFRGQWHAVR